MHVVHCNTCETWAHSDSSNYKDLINDIYTAILQNYTHVWYQINNYVGKSHLESSLESISCNVVNLWTWHFREQKECSNVTYSSYIGEKSVYKLFINLHKLCQQLTNLKWYAKSERWVDSASNNSFAGVFP